MFLKKLKEVFNLYNEPEKDYLELLHESGLLQKIENIRLERESTGRYQLYPCHKEYSSETDSYIYDYNRFAKENPPYTVSLGEHYFRIRAKADGIYLSFRHIQKVKPINRKKINPLKVSEKEISKWFSFLAKRS